MKTITMTLLITVEIPEYNEEGEPKFEADQELGDVRVTVVRDGRDITDKFEVEAYGDSSFVDLLPNVENYSLVISKGHI